MQDVEQLPLVLMDALDLHVKHGVRVEFDAMPFLCQLGQGFLVGPLDGQELAPENWIVRQRRELFEA